MTKIHALRHGFLHLCSPLLGGTDSQKIVMSAINHDVAALIR